MHGWAERSIWQSSIIGVPMLPCGRCATMALQSNNTAGGSCGLHERPTATGQGLILTLDTSLRLVPRTKHACKAKVPDGSVRKVIAGRAREVDMLRMVQKYRMEEKPF